MFQNSTTRVIVSILRRPKCGPRSVREIASVPLLSLGLLLLACTAAAYSWMSLEQHRFVAKARTIGSTAAVPNSAGADDSGITLLVIPKINLEAAILDGTNMTSLLLAPGHLRNTAWPGDAGNAVIAAHRDSFFRRLQELQPGDDVYVRRGGRKFDYTVTAKSIVPPNDLAVADPTTDTRLTLITCFPAYYIGPAPKRLVVVARLRAGDQKPATVAGGRAQP